MLAIATNDVSSNLTSRSLWDRLSKEIKNKIFQQSDILTQFLNGKLSKSQIFDNSSKIWREAFKQDWPGDLALLPRPLPSCYDRIYLIKSRSMYHRVCAVCPRLSVEYPTMQQHFQTYFDGEFDDDGRSLVEGSEKSANDFAWDDKTDLTNVLKKTWNCLLHVPMCHCWLDLLEPWISRNPAQMALLCMAFQHANLLTHLVDFTNQVNLSEGYFVSSKVMTAFGDNEETEMLFHLLRNAELDTLRYLEGIGLLEEDGDFGAKVRASHDSGYETYNRGDYEELLMFVQMEVWEWWFHKTDTLMTVWCVILIIRNLASAERVLENFGDYLVPRFYLQSAATYGTLEAFHVLWQRHDIHTDTYLSKQFRLDTNTKIDSKTAMVLLIELEPSMNPDNIHLLHSVCEDNDATTPLRRCQQFDADQIITFGSMEHVQAFCQACKCPYIDWGRFVFLLIQYAKLPVLKYLHKDAPHAFLKDTFINQAASDGHLDIVSFLHENGHNGCTTDAIDEAALSGYFDIVR
ncbi:hypothetical protein HDU76_001526 [Blyttiomyces sp. JEL0837]|nr:hypothetical protein HDU76_001526 [Blyttiomyces sp. JEL0837]